MPRDVRTSDIAAVIDDLRRRVHVMETTPNLRFSSITSGDLVLHGAAAFKTNDTDARVEIRGFPGFGQAAVNFFSGDPREAPGNPSSLFLSSTTYGDATTTTSMELTSATLLDPGARPVPNVKLVSANAVHPSTVDILAEEVTFSSFTTQKLGFFNTLPAAQPTITGSRGGNAALASLLTGGATLGLWVDGTTP